MKPYDIATLRLLNQYILQPKLNDPAQVLSAMGAIQGQDYPGAKWSLGARLSKCTDKEIEDAFTNKKIVRTWLMRGTLFFVAANDIEWIRALVTQKIITSCTRRYKELELDAPTMIKTNDLLVKFLQEKQSINRTDLLAMIEKQGISTKGQRAAYILQRASLDGLICQSNMVRNSPTYILLDESLGHSKAKARDEGIAELVKRYFTSRGPATVQDFVWWSGLTVTEAKAGLEANKHALHQEVIDGQAFWMSSQNTPLKKASNETLFLPGFDEFLLGYKDRSVSLHPTFNNNWCPGNNGMFFPFIVEKGNVIATWKREFKKNKVSIKISYFDPAKNSLTGDKVTAAIQKYCKYIGTEVVIME